MPYVQAGLVRLHYAQHGDGDEPLVFIHGYTSSHKNWSDTLERLPSRFTSYAIDLRGAGDSDRPGDGYTIPQFAEDIHLATRELGLDTFTLIGHSMGGGTGMRFAANYPERLRKLILVAPVPSDGIQIGDPSWRAKFNALRKNTEMSLAVARQFQTRETPDAEMLRRIEDNQKWQDDAYFSAAESMASLRLADAMSRLTVPTLMVVGDRDGLRPANLADAQRIPNCALHVFYRVGHEVPYDAGQGFTDLIADFVEHGTGTPATMAERLAAMEAMMAAV